MTQRPLLACLLVASAFLAPACSATAPGAAGGTSSGGGGGLEIAEVTLPSTTFMATENFQVKLKVRKAGSGTLRGYGLQTRLGSKVFDFDRPLPVIDNGGVTLSAVGPLPSQTETGSMDVSFWVVDDKGTESNRITTKVLVQ